MYVIGVFTGCMTPWFLASHYVHSEGCDQTADTQAELSLHWVHMFDNTFN